VRPAAVARPGGRRRETPRRNGRRACGPAPAESRRGRDGSKAPTTRRAAAALERRARRHRLEGQRARRRDATAGERGAATRAASCVRLKRDKPSVAGGCAPVAGKVVGRAAGGGHDRDRLCGGIGQREGARGVETAGPPMATARNGSGGRSYPTPAPDAVPGNRERRHHAAATGLR
jgi:hypothetical protein